jgi:hypothetical protein
MVLTKQDIVISFDVVLHDDTLNADVEASRRGGYVFEYSFTQKREAVGNIARNEEILLTECEVYLVIGIVGAEVGEASDLCFLSM